MKCRNCGAELNNGRCEYCGSFFAEDMRLFVLKQPEMTPNMIEKVLSSTIIPNREKDVIEVTAIGDKERRFIEVRVCTKN